ncbi:MAG: hypothetical protein R3F36_01865 [Candidatus Competibacteraceae bacterium]
MRPFSTVLWVAVILGSGVLHAAEVPVEHPPFKKGQYVHHAPTVDG